MTKTILSLLAHRWFQIALLVLLPLAAYSNTFQSPFVFDDQVQITQNPVVHDLGNFFFNSSGYDYLPNRVVCSFTFALNYAFGGDNVIGYHIANLAIHIVNGLLVYAFVRLILRTPEFRGTERQGPGTRDRTNRDSGLGTRDLGHERKGTGIGKLVILERCWEKIGGSNMLERGVPVPSSESRVPAFQVPNTWSLVPFLTALLFVSHPIQTQAVTYIVQRLTSLAALFYLASLVCHLHWRLNQIDGAPFRSHRVLPWWLISLACAILAMKTKEIAFTLPLAVLLCECAFFGRPRLRLLTKITPLLLTLAIIPLTTLNILKPAGDLLSDVSAATSARSVITRWEYLCTQCNVIVTYLRLLVLPINQNLDYDYPISRSLLHPPTLLSLLLLLTLLGVALRLWCPSRSESRVPSPESQPLWSLVPGPWSRLISYGILWFFLTLSVESGIIPIADVIFEHRLYLPSIGFILVIAIVASICAGKLRIPMTASLAAMTLIILLLAGATYRRNQVWQDGISLWNDVKVKSPNKSRSYANLGAYYAEAGRISEAIPEFEAAARLNPDNVIINYNLARAYLEAGRYQDAERIFTIIRRIDPTALLPNVR